MLRFAPLGLAFVLFCSTSSAMEMRGGNCAPCQSYQAPCQSYEMVEKTIMVPTWVTETRKVQVTEYRSEQRQRTYTVCRPVAESKTVTENYTVMVPEQRTREEKVVVCKPVMRQVEQQYTVNVPHTETRTATRRVCKYVPVTETRTVMVAETRSREERYTVSKPVTRQVTQNYTVQVPYVETRQGTRQVCNYVPVTESRTVMVPETRTREEKYTVSKPVNRQVTQNYTVQVPYTETREGTRRVCRWVPVTERRRVCTDQGQYQDVQCTVPACQPSACCGRGLFRRRCCYSAPVCCNNPCAAPAVVVRKVWVPNIVQNEVEVTVQKQQLVNEKYAYSVNLSRPETRTKMVNVCEYVQEEQTRVVPYTVCVPKTETYTVNKPQMANEQYSYNITVCKPETRTKTVNVCQYVQEERTRVVPYTVCVPKTETYTVNKPQMFDQEYNFNVTVCTPETRTRTVTVCDIVNEEQVRQVPYTVCVPQEKTRTYEVTVWKSVPETKTETYMVQVPYCVEKEVAVQVCRMMPRKITCMVPKSAYAGCASCVPGCGN